MIVSALDPSPYVSFGTQAGGALGLAYLFYKVQRGTIGDKDREYERVKKERDDAIADHQSCEELVDRLVGALREAGVAVPWRWKLTPPAQSYQPPREGRADADNTDHRP